MLFETIKTYIELNPDFTIIFLILGKVFASLFVIPAAPFTLLSGAILGTFWGTIVALFGNIIGAVLAFFVSRYLFKDFVQKKILVKYPKLNHYEDKLFKNGFQTVLFLRLVPIFPFSISNYFLGVTEVKFKDYFWGTFIGMIPGTIAYVYFGESLKMLSFVNIVFAVIAILGLTYIAKFWKI